MASNFLTNKFVSEGLTYDDVLLVPDYSEILPKQASLASYFTKNIKLNTPIVSAAMDTVTEHRLAIAMAQEGGIGVLHKNMSIEDQAAQVRKVKRSESGMILDPIILSETGVIEDALKMMGENKIGGIPVVDKNQKLLGIVTNRDLRFEKDMKKLVTRVMTPFEKVITAKQGITLKQAEEVLQNHKIE
ncbi:MAG: IMP dehydrogenase, partial [Bacteroidia bacterium]